MKKKHEDPYKNIELSQKDKIVEYLGVGVAAAMIIFFFLKVLFF